MSNARHRAMKLAVRMLGSEPAACEFLRVSATDLSSWLSEEEVPPAIAVMRAVDYILDNPSLAATHALALGRDAENAAAAGLVSEPVRRPLKARAKLR
jgi:hypothetical protein